MQTTESPGEQRERIKKRIETELDMVGISTRHKGRSYIVEAILIQISKGEGSPESSIIQIAKLHSVAYTSISRAMQTAINNAWGRTNHEDLHTHYTARVDINKGVPTPNELVHFYADKIRKSM